MNHTPGTWRVGTPKGFNASIVYVDDGKEFPEGICSVIGVPLHSTVGEVEKMGRPEYQEALATARLIAAAPELESCLEAMLKITCGSCEGGDGRCVTADGLDACLVARQAKAVLAKVKGASPSAIAETPIPSDAEAARTPGSRPDCE